jgi:hypothetical protein
MYEIYFDDKKYTCKAWADYTDSAFTPSSICIGNGSIYNDWNNRSVKRGKEEPFCLELNANNEVYVYVSEAGNHYISIGHI